MTAATAIGLAAAACTTVSFVPQVVKVLRTRETRAISLAMYLVFSAGVALWLAYGLLVHDLPVILANACTIVLCLVVLALKLRHG
jgi:MtN3 and saliva related transmembrane protein